MSDPATEALVGRRPVTNDVPTLAPTGATEHATPVSVPGAPTFIPMASVHVRVDAGIARTAIATSARTEEELRAAMRRVSITMYSTEWCPVCTRARKWLQFNGISFQELDVEKSDSAERAQRLLNPKGGVPTIDIDGEVMIGFGPEHMQDALRRAAERRARRL